MRVEAACGLAFRRLSPSSISAHWNNWEGADSSLMSDPVRKTSQRRVNTFHSYVKTPMFTLGHSSFGPWVTGSGEGPVVLGNVHWWAKPWFVRRVVVRASEMSLVLKSHIGDCTGDDYHGSCMKKPPSQWAKFTSMPTIKEPFCKRTRMQKSQYYTSKLSYWSEDARTP